MNEDLTDIFDNKQSYKILFKKKRDKHVMKINKY